MYIRAHCILFKRFFLFYKVEVWLRPKKFYAEIIKYQTKNKSKYEVDESVWDLEAESSEQFTQSSENTESANLWLLFCTWWKC